MLALSVMIAAPSMAAFAQSCRFQEGLTGCNPAAAVRADLGPFDARGFVFDLKPTEFATGLAAGSVPATAPRPAQTDSVPQTNTSRASGTALSPAFCRRDDYAFLPAGATAGISCDTSSKSNSPDPRDIARSMFDRLDMPWLRLGMNPRLGMVAVPTWFWVEGYDGGGIPVTDNLVLSHDECRQVADRNAEGDLVLDGDGAPVTHRECQTITDTLTVELRVWPRAYQWTFGDKHGTSIPCPDIAACTAGLGTAYTDPHSPSPIAHAYRWSSLGINGAADAYTIRLGITF